MAVIHNLKELNELGRDLKILDSIYFTNRDEVIKYKVMGKYLSLPKWEKGLPNGYIFQCLCMANPEVFGMSNKEAFELAEQSYGYPPYNTCADNWPAFKLDDFPALERLIREIYKMLGDNSLEINKEEFIFSRFEILDL